MREYLKERLQVEDVKARNRDVVNDRGTDGIREEEKNDSEIRWKNRLEIKHEEKHRGPLI